MTASSPQSRPIVLIPILSGAILFCADLLRCLPETTSVHPIMATREGVAYLPPLRQLERHNNLWVIDNTICSGRTLRIALDALPPGAQSAVLFGLPCATRAAVPTLIGMELGAPFVAGYGADFVHRKRGLADLWNLRGGQDQ